MLQVPRRVEVEPGASEEVRLHRVDVGNGDHQRAAVGQPFVTEAQDPIGLGQVLQHVPDGDEIERSRRKATTLERPQVQSETGDLSGPSPRLRGQLRSMALVTRTDEARQKLAAPAADVEDASPTPATGLPQEIPGEPGAS